MRERYTVGIWPRGGNPSKVSSAETMDAAIAYIEDNAESYEGWFIADGLTGDFHGPIRLPSKATP